MAVCVALVGKRTSMKTKAACLLALLFLVGVAVAQPARAQVYNLYQGNTFSYSGLNFTISSCSFEDNPPAHTGSKTCSGANYATYLPSGVQYYIAGDPSAPATSVIIEALNGGSSGTQVPIFSYTCSTSGGCSNSNAYDLGVTLTVTPASGTLSSAGQTVSTTSDPSDPSGDVSIAETINPASDPTHVPSLCSLASNLARRHSPAPSLRRRHSRSTRTFSCRSTAWPMARRWR